MLKIETIMIIIFLIIVSSGCIEPDTETKNDNSEQWKPEFGIQYLVNVTYIFDGDTISALFPSGKEQQIRFLGVDTPELFPNNETMEKFNNVTDQNCLTTYSFEIRSFTESWLKNSSIYIEFDEYAGFYDFNGRWIAYVTLENDTDFNKMLLERGFARVPDDTYFEKKDVYLPIQANAKEYKIGLWGCTKSE